MKIRRYNKWRIIKANHMDHWCKLMDPKTTSARKDMKKCKLYIPLNKSMISIFTQPFTEQTDSIHPN